MDRSALETTLNAIYAAREANDAAGILAHFAPDGCYHIVGDPGCCGAAQAHRGPALKPALEGMCGLFQVRQLQVGHMIIDGSHAAVTLQARFTFAPTGETVNTTMVDIWTFRDGRVADVAEYLDTAHLARLQGQAPA